MRLLKRPKPGQRKVWFVIDELASLQRLPQLHTAITESRNRRIRSTRTAALAPPEQGVSGRDAESVTTGLREAAVPVPTVPEIDLEGFGLGL